MKSAEVAASPFGPNVMIMAGTAAGRSLRPSASPASIRTLAISIQGALSATHGVTLGDVTGLAGHYIAHPGQGVGVSTQAAKDAAGGVGSGIVKAVAPWLKIGAGGFVVIVSGLALVYVAGRNTAPVAAAKTAVKVATPGGQAVRSVARKAKGAPKARAKRKDTDFYKAAYANTAEAKAGTSAARRSKVLPRHAGVANRTPRRKAAA
jgi:hypothetical protein